jgi:hypothetical protein
MRKKIPPLIIDNVENLSNLHMLSIIEYHRQEYVCIVDNLTANDLKVYVITDNSPFISSKLLISEAIYWFYHCSSYQQLSVYLANKEIAFLASPLYKSFELAGISRVVGKIFQYPTYHKPKVKRRRVTPISAGIEIKFSPT